MSRPKFERIDMTGRRCFRVFHGLEEPCPWCVAALVRQGQTFRQEIQGQLDKRVAYERMKADLGLSDGEIAYVGDDVVDLPVMRRAGLAIAVQDAHAAVKQHAHWQTPSPGGRGAGRDVCELLMEARGVLAAALQSYLE